QRVAGVLRVTWPLMLVGIYLVYAFISYQAIVNLSTRWYPVFALVLPGATALVVIPVLAGCEASNREARLRAAPSRKTALVLFWVGALTYPVYLVHSSI